jgi:hypothetical protein
VKMAKLVLSLNIVSLGEYLIDKASLTVDRKPLNDIQINRLALTDEYVVILYVDNHFLIES